MGRKVVEDPRIAEMRAREPHLGPAGVLCVEAWRILSSTRTPFAVPIGLGGAVITSGSIPWPAISDWCSHKGLGPSETDIVAFVLRRLDADRAKRENARIQQLAARK